MAEGHGIDLIHVTMNGYTLQARMELRAPLDRIPGLHTSVMLDQVSEQRRLRRQSKEASKRENSAGGMQYNACSLVLADQMK